MFVGNLSFDVSREELIEAFGAAGKVVDVKIPTDRETGRPRGFAFVEFADDEAAQKSISLLNGKDLKGRAMRVNEAENRPPRAPGAGPSFRPSYGAAPGRGPGWGDASRGAPPPFPPPEDFFGDRGRARGKGSRRNIRRRKRGFE
ncbi:MAG TPA: RNA-binding protein [Vicinamibacteria bacterium]